MKEFTNTAEILQFAITNEQEAVDFYHGLALRAKNESMKKAFTSFAAEEMGHKKRLLNILETGINSFSFQEVSDLKIADYMIDIIPSPEMSYADALVVAMKKEKAAFRLYSDLAERTTDENLRKLFNNLALEESKHKLRFELEYDEVILKEN
jgi:rubrerythrin